MSELADKFREGCINTAVWGGIFLGRLGRVGLIASGAVLAVEGLTGKPYGTGELVAFGLSAAATIGGAAVEAHTLPGGRFEG